MSGTSTDRVNGLVAGLAVKAPCVAATTANITLSGEQTVDGVLIAEGDRVLVKDQTDQTKNGIYCASTSAWSRDSDFDGNRDVVQGTLCTVYNPVSGNTIYQVTAANDITIGTSNITFALIGAPVETAEAVGVLLHGNPTAAETAIGMTAYSALNTAGNIVAPQYEPGDCRRYGWGGTASDNRLALQAALNAARCDTADTNRNVTYPAGLYDLDAAVYGYYHATLNNVAAAFGTQRFFGRYTLRGQGSGHDSNAINGEARGTTLNFTSATADGLMLSDYNSGSIHSKDIWATDFAVTGATTGTLVQARASQWTHLRRLVIYNNAAGIALDNTDSNTHCSFKQIIVNGAGTTGTGIKCEADVSGGSLSVYEGVMVESCAVGLDWGGAYDAGQSSFAKNVTYQNCSFQNNVVGTRLRHGVTTARFVDCYWEGNAGAAGASVIITDSCGIDDNNDYGQLVFSDCHYSDNDDTPGKQFFQIGSTGNTTEQDSHGNVLILRPNILTAPTDSGLPTPTAFITKYNNTLDGLVQLHDPQWAAGASTGRLIKLMDSAAHYGPVQLKGMAGLQDMNPTRIWVSSAHNDLHGCWCANGSDIVADHLTDTAADYTNAPALPSVVASTRAGSNTFLLTLPDNARVFEHQSRIMESIGNAASTIRLDGGAANTVVGDGATADTGQYCDMTTEAYRCADVWMRAQADWIVYPVHGTIDMA